MTPDLVRLLRRLCVPVLVLTAVFTAAGLVMHHWPAPDWPYEVSGGWRALARTAEGLGTAAVAVPPVVLLVAGMRVGFRRWRESVFLLTSMLIAGLVLIVASAAVPGTTFPAGASGLAAATYGAISVVLGRRLGTPVRRTLGGILPWFLVLGVGVGQLYLGEYRVEEIVVSVAAGVAAVAVATRYVLLGGSFEQRPAIDDIPLPDRRRAAVIVNPTKVADLEEERRAVTAYLAAAGWHPPWWLETRLDELGVGHAKAAAEGGADVVFACGGDGTIMSVLSGLAGTGVPLAILPAGTGNLLARNLQLPPDRDACLRIGLGGVDRKIDVGRVDENHRFAVMAGMGLDAAMIMDAPEKLKKRIGWPAYAVSGARHLFDRRAHVTITVDDAEPVELRARGIVIGNVGKLQAGMVLMPDARPDDGILDVAVLVPKSLRHWLMLSLHVIRRRPRARGARIEHFRGRRIHVECDRVWPREIDGDLLEPSKEMTVVVEPQALIVRIPPGSDVMT
ncbi:diacylglycerol/lipid kinase family protein [Sporichthya polymorpha]|uniref:diacylglycerol/lipid kinase family protein n=1 Tax=Sporichthya polymorpha TaxID=35751 RepID=UPI000378E173|nr:diacylglycerol kinase family protein [Sporichthya polymorpha]